METLPIRFVPILHFALLGVQAPIPSAESSPTTALVSWECDTKENTEPCIGQLLEQAAKLGGDSRRLAEHLAAFRFASPENAARFLAGAERLPKVTNAEFSKRLDLLSAPNDPWFPAQGNLQTIRAQEAWALLPSNTKQVPVAVIDTGACKQHPDLAAKILPGSMDFSGGPWGQGPSSSVVVDPHGHGTHVAGIIAASANNGEGIAGVAPNATILPYQVFQALGATTEAIVQGIHHARQQLATTPAKVMNFSLGGTECAMGESLDFLAEAIQAALDDNFVVVAAAGNGVACSGGGTLCGSNDELYPAYFQDVISVANTTNWDDKVPSSQWGWPDVAAPGHLVLSTFPVLTGWTMPCFNNGYFQLTGTSMSSPTVAGLAAMLLAVPGIETNAQVRQLIFQSCVPISIPAGNGCGIPNPWVQHGRVDALNAMEAAYGLPPTPTLFGKPKIHKVQGQKPWSKGYVAEFLFAPEVDLNLKLEKDQDAALHTLALAGDSEALRVKSVSKNDNHKSRIYVQAAASGTLPSSKIRLSLRASIQANDGKARRVGVRMFRYDKDEWTPEIAFEIPAGQIYQDLDFDFAQNLAKLVNPTGTMRFRIEAKWAKDSSQNKPFTLRLDRAAVSFDAP